jgi:hypothetical protein
LEYVAATAAEGLKPFHFVEHPDAALKAALPRFVDRFKISDHGSLWVSVRFLSDASEHYWAQLIAVSEGPCVVWIVGVAELLLGADLTEERPAFFEQCFVNYPSLVSTTDSR